jgi:hypothetical protein
MRFSGYALVNDNSTHVLLNDESVKTVDDTIFQYHKSFSRSLLVGEAEELLNNKDIDLAKLEKYFVDEDIKTVNSYDRVLIGGLYKHFKGKLVRLLNVAKYSEDATKLFAIYDCGPNGIYARPLDMFLSEVDRNKYPNVTQKYRFELLEDK